MLRPYQPRRSHARFLKPVKTHLDKLYYHLGFIASFLERTMDGIFTSHVLAGKLDLGTYSTDS